MSALTPEGFYRVTFDGYSGVGHCRHVSIEGADFESWSLMYLRDIPGAGQHIWNANINSTDRQRQSLVIGPRIRGLFAGRSLHPHSPSP